jgi:hypothetical protein
MRQRRSSTGSGSIPSGRGATRRTSCSRSSCGPTTRAAITPETTSRCWAERSNRSLSSIAGICGSAPTAPAPPITYWSRPQPARSPSSRRGCGRLRFTADGEVRQHADVVEITDLLDCPDGRTGCESSSVGNFVTPEPPSVRQPHRTELRKEHEASELSRARKDSGQQHPEARGLLDCQRMVSIKRVDHHDSLFPSCAPRGSLSAMQGARRANESLQPAFPLVRGLPPTLRDSTAQPSDP